MMARLLFISACLYFVLSTEYSVLSGEDTPSAAPPAPSGPLEILEKFDIGPSQIESFFSGQPLSAREEDVLVRILYHFRRLGLDNLLRWRQNGVGWEQLAAEPVEHRMQVFRVSGRAKYVEAVRLLPEQAEIYEFDHYFRVRIALSGSPDQAVVAARRIPDAWPIDTPL